MSTRCQIGFYETPDQALDAPDVLLYRHSDGYPQGRWGVLAGLLPWAKDFAEQRGLDDVEYAAARGLVALLLAHDCLSDYLSYGICGDKQLHGDIEYYYRVDPNGVTVYRVGYDGTFAAMQGGQHYALDAPFPDDTTADPIHG